MRPILTSSGVRGSLERVEARRVAGALDLPYRKERNILSKLIVRSPCFTHLATGCLGGLLWWSEALDCLRPCLIKDPTVPDALQQPCSVACSACGRRTCVVNGLAMVTGGTSSLPRLPWRRPWDKRLTHARRGVIGGPSAGACHLRDRCGGGRSRRQQRRRIELLREGRKGGMSKRRGKERKSSGVEASPSLRVLKYLMAVLSECTSLDIDKQTKTKLTY